MASSAFFPPSFHSPLAVVTGAASGIGLALVSALLARGADVVAIDLDTDGIDDRAQRYSVDVRDAQAMAALADSFAGRPVSHVFANAGIGGMRGDVLHLDDQAWLWAWEVNMLGTLRTLRLWWPSLCAGRGTAVATVSAAAVTSFPGAGPYRASKAALLAALEGLHYQAQGSGVSVHALCPGMVRSEICNVERYSEAAGLRVAAASPFSAHVAAAMQHAEPAHLFARRVLERLDEGAPFYWLTHPDSFAWMQARHQTLEESLPPFSDFILGARATEAA